MSALNSYIKNFEAANPSEARFGTEQIGSRKYPATTLFSSALEALQCLSLIMVCSTAAPW